MILCASNLLGQSLPSPGPGVKSYAASGIIFVNSTTQQLGPSGGTTSAVNMSGANLCVIGISSLVAVALTVTSSPANTWNALTVHDSASARSTIYYAYSPSVSSSMTFTVSAGSNMYAQVNAVCVSGSVGSTVDQQGGGFLSASTASIQGSSITPSAAGTLVFVSGSTSTNPSGTSFSIDSSIILTGNLPYVGSAAFGIGSGYLIQGGAAAINPTVSWTGLANTAAIALASFK